MLGNSMEPPNRWMTWAIFAVARNSRASGEPPMVVLRCRGLWVTELLSEL